MEIFKDRRERREARERDFEAKLELKRQIRARCNQLIGVMKVEQPEQDETGYSYSVDKYLELPAFKGLVLFREYYDKTKNPEEDTGPDYDIHILGQNEKGLFDFMYDDRGVWSEPMRYEEHKAVTETLDAIILGLQSGQQQDTSNPNIPRLTESQEHELAKPAVQDVVHMEPSPTQ